MKWCITYYSRKVFEEILAMPIALSAKYVAITERMSETGPHLGMPHTRAMGNGLFEIRLKGQDGIARVFYCMQQQQEIVVLHSFIKKTQKTPKRELDLAIHRLKEVKQHG